MEIIGKRDDESHSPERRDGRWRSDCDRLVAMCTLRRERVLLANSNTPQWSPNHNFILKCLLKK
jgi:hypothetical protein